MENIIEPNFDFYFNILLEYCKSKYEMPEDKCIRLKNHFFERYENWLKSLNDILNIHESINKEETEIELLQTEEFYFDFSENPQKY